MLNFLVKIGVLKVAEKKKNYQEEQDNVSEEVPLYQEIEGKVDVVIENPPKQKQKQKPMSLQIEGEVDVKEKLRNTIEELRCIEEEGQPIGAKHLAYSDYQDKSYREELKDTGLMDNGKCASCGRLVYNSWKKNPDGNLIYHKYCYQKKYFGKNNSSYYNSNSRKYKKPLKHKKKSNRWF